MNDVLIVKAIEELKPFLNDKGVVEIVVRGAKKRIKAFQKVALNNLGQAKEAEAMGKIANAIKNADLGVKNFELLKGIGKISQIGLLMNGLNLCATCAGFAIMYEKLDKMSIEINRQFNQLQNVIKKGNDVQANFEFNKMLSEHTNMLDSRRRQQPYSEEKMRELVDGEYNVLVMLIEVFQADISADTSTNIFTIFSLLSMLTVSLCYFDEVYYQNNHEALGDTDVWHSAHNKWTDVYDKLSEDWVIERIQDYALFEKKMSTRDTDVYYMSLMDQVEELKQEVGDNQRLIVSVGDIDLLRRIREASAKEVRKMIDEAYEETCGEENDPEIRAEYEKALQQVALA